MENNSVEWFLPEDTSGERLIEEALRVILLDVIKLQECEVNDYE